jgi:hypothetical protein
MRKKRKYKTPTPVQNTQAKVVENKDSNYNRFTSFFSRLGMQYDNEREVYTAVGYPKDITFEDYNAKFKRLGIATTVVSAFPDACWRASPIIKEVATPLQDTVFEKAAAELVENMNLYSYLHRLDVLSGIGAFGVMVMGFGDGQPLSAPVVKAKKLMYLQPFSEDHVVINEWETNPTSPDYGMPKMYKIEVQVGDDTKEIDVHPSRIFHAAEKRYESDFYGTPRMENVYNHLMDIEKISASSGEMFWRGSNPGLNISIDPDARLTDEDKAILRDDITDFINNQKRVLLGEGLDITAIPMGMADPQPHLDAQLKLISAATGIPSRILSGSELGELASTQDSGNFLDRVTARQKTYVTPFLLKPFIDRMIEVGVLPAPSNGYFIEWKDLQTPTDKDKADVGRQITESIVRLSEAMYADNIMPLEKILEKAFYFTPEEVEATLAKVEENKKEYIAYEDVSVDTETSAQMKEENDIQ